VWIQRPFVCISYLARLLLVVGIVRIKVALCLDEFNAMNADE